MVEEKNFWLEIPRNEHELEFTMWFRTLHSKNDDYFAWIINDNGTISSQNNKDLVLGFGISLNQSHWKDMSNEFDWKTYKALGGFEKKTKLDDEE